MALPTQPMPNAGQGLPALAARACRVLRVITARLGPCRVIRRWILRCSRNSSLPDCRSTLEFLAEAMDGSTARNTNLLVRAGKVPQSVPADTRTLPKIYSSWHVWLLAGLISLALAFGTVLLQWFAYVHDVVFPALHGIRITAPVLVLAVSAVLVRLLLAQAQRHRRDNLRRYLVVAECNHHIRNALQTMRGLSYMHGYDEIDQAVTRIEQTLTEILPQVNE